MNSEIKQKYHCKLKVLQDQKMFRHWAEEEINGKSREQIKQEVFKVSLQKWKNSLSPNTLLTFSDDYLFEEDEPGLKPYAALDSDVEKIEGGGLGKFFHTVFWPEAWDGISKDIDEQINIIKEKTKVTES